MANKNKFSVLYKINLNIAVKGVECENFPVSASDIVSISLINNYDLSSYPIIRIRLFSDISVIQKLTKYPDNIYLSLNMLGNVYQMNNEDNKSPVPVGPASNIQFSLKGYIENKNIPTSIMDQYDHGLKKDDVLNIDKKVPIEIYCYNDTLINFMKQKAKSIFKSMSITTAIETMFRNQGIVKFSIDPLINQEKFNQLLLPNLTIMESLSFFDAMYGMYPKGAMVYGDIDKLYICNSDAYNGTKPLPIHVASFKNDSDMGGMREINYGYQMSTKAENVSVITETDIEKVLNGEKINDINLSTLNTTSTALSKIYKQSMPQQVGRVQRDIRATKLYLKNNFTSIETPDILHKSRNNYVSSMVAARITEKVTKVDVSGVGFDIGKMKINTRYNLIFDSPIRGLSMGDFYRPTTTIHVLTNLDSNLFIAQTTMNLCNN